MLPRSGYFLLRKPPESLDNAPPLSRAPARSILGRLVVFVGVALLGAESFALSVV